MSPVAIYEIGCFAGALISFFFGERFSRRACMIMGNLITIVGATLQAVSQNMTQLIAGRVITGLVRTEKLLHDGFGLTNVGEWTELFNHTDLGFRDFKSR